MSQASLTGKLAGDQVLAIAQADAVKSERRLLDASDPVPDIRKAAVDHQRAPRDHCAFVRSKIEGRG